MADRVIGMADVRNTSAAAWLVRRAAGFPQRPIPMFWYSQVPNFGDVLSAVIVEYVSNGTPVRVPRRYRGKVLAVGSVLDCLAEGDS
jgi:hypothetical protein